MAGTYMGEGYMNDGEQVYEQLPDGAPLSNAYHSTDTRASLAGKASRSLVRPTRPGATTAFAARKAAAAPVVGLAARGAAAAAPDTNQDDVQPPSYNTAHDMTDEELVKHTNDHTITRTVVYAFSVNPATQAGEGDGGRVVTHISHSQAEAFKSAKAPYLGFLRSDAKSLDVPKGDLSKALVREVTIKHAQNPLPYPITIDLLGVKKTDKMYVAGDPKGVTMHLVSGQSVSDMTVKRGNSALTDVKTHNNVSVTHESLLERTGTASLEDKSKWVVFYNDAHPVLVSYEQTLGDESAPLSEMGRPMIPEEDFQTHANLLIDEYNANVPTDNVRSFGIAVKPTSGDWGSTKGINGGTEALKMAQLEQSYVGHVTVQYRLLFLGDGEEH